MNRLKEFVEGSGTQVGMKKGLFFLGVVSALIIYAPVRNYLNWSLVSPYYTYIVIIPFLSAYLVFRRRSEIFSNGGYAIAQGSILACMGILFFAAGAAMGSGWNRNDVHAVTAAAALVVIIGTFIMLFGTRVFREARFALIFLIFMIPLPSVMEQWVIQGLQLGSAEFVGILFSLTGEPVLREGVAFHLPGMSIEVAPPCSGIRSGLALFITAVLAGHMYLKTTWAKTLLVLAAIPVTIFKNAIRIVTLTLLGLYVDRGFLGSSLHRDGGIVFFVLALLIMAPILAVLRNGEK